MEGANGGSVATPVIGRPISLPNWGDVASNGRVPPHQAFSSGNVRVSADNSIAGGTPQTGVAAIRLKRAMGPGAMLGVDFRRACVVLSFHPRTARDRRCRPLVP